MLWHLLALSTIWWGVFPVQHPWGAGHISLELCILSGKNIQEDSITVTSSPSVTTILYFRKLCDRGQRINEHGLMVPARAATVPVESAFQ